jgi:hypothetical protein
VAVQVHTHLEISVQLVAELVALFTQRANPLRLTAQSQLVLAVLEKQHISQLEIKEQIQLSLDYQMQLVAVAVQLVNSKARLVVQAAAVAAEMQVLAPV